MARQEAIQREEIAKHEVLKREKLAVAKEQALLQVQKEVEEKNAKREQDLLENEYKRQRMQAELLFWICKPRTEMSRSARSLFPGAKLPF